MSGWRDKGEQRSKPETSPSSKSEKPRAGWRSRKQAASSRQHWKDVRNRESSSFRGLQIGGLVALFVVLMAVLIAVVLRMPRAVPLVALSSGAYEYPLPPLPLVAEDADWFKDLLGRSHKNVVLKSAEQQLNSAEQFLDELAYRLQDVRPGGPAKNVVLLFVRAHGIVTANGEPCFLLPSSDRLDESTWLPVERLFETAKKEVPNAKLVFLMDSGSHRRLWQAGVLHNRFVSHLETLVSSYADDGIIVIHATDAGQVSHPGPELKGSVFAHYLALGIRGAADSSGDDEVTLSELHQYVRSHVDRFANARRADVQQPLLLPREVEDCKVAHVGPAFTDPVIPLEQPKTAINFSELWDRFAKLRKAKAYSADPLAWAELEARLVRLESLVLAGRAYESQSDANVVTGLMNSLTTAVQVDSDSASSLVIAERSLERQLRQAARDQVAAWKKSIGTEKPLPVPKFAEPMASCLAWEEAVTGDTSDIRHAMEILQAATTRRGVEFTEIHYLLLLQLMDAGGTTGDLMKQALACQRKAEEAAGPRDRRSHYWIRRSVVQSDQINDHVIDGMLTGSEDEKKRVVDALEQLVGDESDGDKGRYGQAVKIAETISRAYKVRDEAWATIPHLVAWIDSEAWLDSAAVQTDDQVRSEMYSKTLSKLIQSTHALADAIDRLPSDLDSFRQVDEHFRQRVDTVDVDLSALLSAFDLRTDTLRFDETPDERTIRQIGTILAQPLIPDTDTDIGNQNDVETRNVLRKRFLDHRGQEYLENLSDTASKIRDDSLYLDWLVTQDTPHVLAVLDLELLEPNVEGIPASRLIPALSDAANDRDRVDRLAKLEAELRSRLQNVKASATKLASKTYNGTPLESRRGLSKADRLLRASATIFGRRLWQQLERDQDPITRLNDFDQHAYHLWQGARALRNWWGAPNGSRAYFIESANHQHTSKAKYSALPLKGRPEIGRAAHFQTQLREAIIKQERILESWRPVVQAPEIDVIPGDVSHSVTYVPVDGLPPGRVAIYLSNDEGLLPVRGPNDRLIRRRAVNVREDATLHHVIRDEAKLTTGSLTANALFRGHRRETSFNVNDLGEAIVVWNERKPQDPSITVKGDSREKSQIMFVLDCSGSMDAPFGNTTRLPFAIRTLKGTVNLLDRNHFLGLILFGHQFRDRADFPPDEDPGNDVECVYSINRRNDKNELRKRLDERAKAKGATPLYNAIQQAIDSFDENLGGFKTVVVLTDGDDRVPPRSDPRSADQVVRHWNRSVHKPRIDIVSIIKRLEKPEELKKITSATGGDIHLNVTAEKLAETIEGLVGLRKFSITDLQTGKESAEKRLGDTWTEEKYDWELFGATRNYRVQVGNATKDIFLEGGERIEVVYNRRQNQLEFEAFTKDSNEERFEVPESNVYVFSHFPFKEDDSVVFQASVQSLDPEVFSVRPKHVWAEIQPAIFGVRQLPVYAFDCDFEMGTPVPVFQFRVRNWPGSESAKVKLWFTYDDEIPNEKQFVVQSDLPQPIRVEQDGVTVVAIREKLTGTKNRLIVKELHGDNSSHFPLRIRLIPPAKKTEHQVYETARRIHHVFEFDDRNKVQIGVSSKSHLRGGWYETESIEVRLPNR